MTAIPRDDADTVEPGDRGESFEPPPATALPRRVRRAGRPATPRPSAGPDDGTLDRVLGGLREI